MSCQDTGGTLAVLYGYCLLICRDAFDYLSGSWWRIVYCHRELSGLCERARVCAIRAITVRLYN